MAKVLYCELCTKCSRKCKQVLPCVVMYCPKFVRKEKKPAKAKKPKP